MNLITTYESHLSNENYHFSDVFLWGVEEVDCKPIFDMDSLITVDYQIYKNFGRGRNKVSLSILILNQYTNIFANVFEQCTLVHNRD